MYKRVLLKLSGEQLAGQFDGGIDPNVAGWIANEVKKATATDTQVVIMVGGGNFVRGAQIAGHGIRRVTADHMGMLGTIINALALTDIFEAHGLATRCLTNIFAEQVAEPFVHRLANKHLEKGRVVIVAGGIGRPYLTTDTAAVSLALELDCEVVLKATKVDGVYDKDPTQYDDAVKIEKLSYQQAVQDEDIKIMDKAAMGLAMEHKMPIVIFDSMQEGSLGRATAGELVGTIIS
ncbi:UMP kinase [Candidatus Saccharibacteria bacterium]|nr:UMP kinase [Candidatus Saccharibacteria bacterium]MBI3338324.1 UMP kinase [Candidatus Saccharibacteria bacterium]